MKGEGVTIEQGAGMPRLYRLRAAVCGIAALMATACAQEGAPDTAAGKAPSAISAEQLPPATLEQKYEPGELVATLSIPRLCDLQVKAYALSREEILNGINLDGGTTGSGGSPLNRLELESDPQPDCPATLEDAEKQRRDNPYFATRGQRSGLSELGYTDRNLNGVKDRGEERSANNYVPAAGYWPGTGKPGEEGRNVIFMAHRTRFSAAFASINVLQPGDTINVISAGQDSATYTYTVTTQEVVNDTEVARVMYPEGYESRATLTMFACEPQGSADSRIVVRATLTAQTRR